MLALPGPGIGSTRPWRLPPAHGGRAAPLLQPGPGRADTGVLEHLPSPGALICRQDAGNAQVFQCFYQAWSFNTRGELRGVPDEAGYGEGFDKKALGLKPPPRAEYYRGFYFVSFNPEI